MSIERTLVLIKPDGVRRGLVGEILSRYERKGLQLVALQQRTATGELADEHYAEHTARDFYPPLRAFITSGPLVALVLDLLLAVAGRLLMPWAKRPARRRRRPGPAGGAAGARAASGTEVAG